MRYKSRLSAIVFFPHLLPTTHQKNFEKCLLLAFEEITFPNVS